MNVGTCKTQCAHEVVKIIFKQLNEAENETIERRAVDRCSSCCHSASACCMNVMMLDFVCPARTIIELVQS